LYTYVIAVSKPWFGAGSAVFGGKVVQSSPKVGEMESNNEEGDERVCVDENEPNVHFEPLVRLPEVVTTTGEENEVIVYKDRVKLYRFDGKEWKERGNGDLKILKHNNTGK